MELTGGALARHYHDEVVRPLLDAWRPGAGYAAGRLGTGSDVLGLDDATSRDHDWGLRLTLLVDGPDVGPVDALLDRGLPDAYLGLPTRFALTKDPEVRHRVDVRTVDDLAAAHLGTAAFTDPAGPTTTDWLSLTGQAVLEVTAGPVFADDGRLAAVRGRLGWYPDDVWRQVVAADWARIGEELPFVGRTAARGDGLGSRVVAARLVDALVHLGFLLERRWPPYPKWRGTMFARLPRAAAALPHLVAALEAHDGTDREAALVAAAELLGDVQRDTGLPTPDRVTEPFHDRQFRGVRDDVTRLLLDGAAGPGGVEQWVGNVPLLTSPLRRALVAATVPG